MESPEEIDLSISLVNYNLTQMVIDLIKSAYDTTKDLKMEFLVVDNASSDSPERIIQAFPEAKMIKNPENVFFIKADNQNILRAKGRFVLTITPDAIFTPGALESMVRFLEQNKDVGAVVPKLVYPDGGIQRPFSLFPTFLFGLFTLLGINHFFPNNPLKRKIMPTGVDYEIDKAREAEILYGACIMVRREVLDTVGAKDEKFVHGWDEYDWCRRIKQGGFRLYYLPQACVIHYRSVSFNKAMGAKNSRRILRKHHWAGFLRLYKKHSSFPAYCLLKALSAVRIFFEDLKSKMA